MKILDLGCGRNKYKSSNPEDVVIGLDKFELECVNVVWDLEKTPLPFKDNEFDEIRAKQVFEHITLQSFYHLMEELWRILKHGGIIKIWTPHSSGMYAHCHIDHKQFFNTFSFNLFRPEIEQNYFTKAKFKVKKVYLRYVQGGKLNFLNYLINPIININHVFTEKILCGFLRIDEMYIEMEVIK